MTIVVNLFGGAGTGKSTVASDLNAKLKLMGCSVELVHEVIKKWAWENRVPGKFDQIYILGQQTYSESIVYNKVDYIVTDSPLLLIPFYEELIVGETIVKPAVFNFIKFAEKNDVTYLNFWLKRPETYETEGRYQTHEEAIEIDKKLLLWLENHNIPLIMLSNNHEERIHNVLSSLNLLGKVDEDNK